MRIIWKNRCPTLVSPETYLRLPGPHSLGGAPERALCTFYSFMHSTSIYWAASRCQALGIQEWTRQKTSLSLVSSHSGEKHMLWRKIKQTKRVGKERAMWITEKKNIPGKESSKYKGPGLDQVRHTWGTAGRSTELEQNGQGEAGRRWGQRGRGGWECQGLTGTGRSRIFLWVRWEPSELRASRGVSWVCRRASSC